MKTFFEWICDSYKIGMNQLHEHNFFEDSPTKVLMSYSNFTPRKKAYFEFSDDDERLVSYGIRHTVQYIHDLAEEFFSTDKEKVYNRLVVFLTSHYGGDVEVDHKRFLDDIMKLHDLGYLPLEYRAIDEGLKAPIGIPLFTVKNTHPEFSWLINNLETLTSQLYWPMVNTATKIDQFYKQAKHYGEMSTPKEVLDLWLPVCVHNFEARGMFGPEHSSRAGSASCIPFIGSDTVSSIPFAQEYYDYDPTIDPPIAVSIRASEHADITRLLSEFRYRGITEDTELEVIKKLAEHTEGMFSYVADSENYYRTISEYALAAKDYILNRKDGSNGLPAKWVWRPDSSRLRPLEVICGLKVVEEWDDIKTCYLTTEDGEVMYETSTGKYFEVKDNSTDMSWKQEMVFTEIDPLEVKGSLQILWEVFGGEEVDTPVGKMKMLSPKVGLIYGESISQKHQKEIYERMIANGFSVSNLIIGKGSYANLEGNTRDMFSMSFKQTFSLAEIEGKIVNLEQQKTPMGDVSKKSAKGLLMVDENFKLHQEVDEATEQTGVLTLLYKDGVMEKEQSFLDIKEKYFSN
ncbi:nicotinamide phosphoribosyltransferase [Pseudoalteromonas phage PH357]|nr:nicotinamide phosphoribosyltransferase [Pseudoalteromonas phage PH357]